MIPHKTSIGAALEVVTSQPAVSSGIRDMEGQAGLLVFDRRSVRLFPQQVAKILYQKSQGNALLSCDLDETNRAAWRLGQASVSRGSGHLSPRGDRAIFANSFPHGAAGGGIAIVDHVSSRR